MSTRKKESSINLLPERGFESTAAGRFVTWLLGTFRVIVMAIEIIVMMAFISRFWLDTQNSGLNEQIQQKQAIIAASIKTENEFRDIQKRLQVFKQFSSNSGIYSKILKEVARRTPANIILEIVNVGNDGITMSGTSANERSLQQYMVNLLDSEYIAGVTIADVGSQSSNTGFLGFKLKVKLNKEKS